MSKKSRTARRKRAVSKRAEWACPPPEVAAIIRTLYCDGESRQAAVRHSAARAKIKFRKVMTSGFIGLESVMQILRVGVCTQSGPCGSEIVPAVAVSISAFARALSLEIVSQAGAAAFPVLFTATICSKMQRGEVVGGLNVVPRVPWLGRHGFSDVHFNQFKVSCRGMSSMWRRIKSAAVAKGIVCSPPVVGNSVAIGVINPERRNRYYPVCTKAKLA